VADTNRTAVAVTLLAGDEAARRLVLSWPLVAVELKDRAVLAEWAKVAGISFSLTERLSHALFRHQVCLPDRTVDAEALKVVTHIAAATLRRAGAKS